MKKTIEVIKTVEIEIEIKDKMFGDMTQEEFLVEFSRSFFKVSSIDDIYKYIASQIDVDSFGELFIEGVGFIDSWSTQNMNISARYNITYTDVETEII